MNVGRLQIGKDHRKPAGECRLKRPDTPRIRHASPVLMLLVTAVGCCPSAARWQGSQCGPQSGSAGWCRTYCSRLLPGIWMRMNTLPAVVASHALVVLVPWGPRRGLRFGPGHISWSRSPEPGPARPGMVRPVAAMANWLLCAEAPRGATRPTSGLDASPLGHIVCQLSGPLLGARGITEDRLFR
jgi:hypothetical protein